MAKAVGQPSGSDGANCGNDEDRDGANLSRGRGIAHLAYDGRYKEGARVAGIHDTHIHDDSAIYLPICKDAAS